MSLKFVLGKASTDHQASLVGQLKESQITDPAGQFFYLVPNHIKFEAEVSILEALGQEKLTEQNLFAQSNVQVLSFTRLAWFFLKNTPYYQIPRLSQSGLNMLVYQLISEHEDDLTIFRGEKTQTGFISQLVSQLKELKVGCVTVDDLTRIAGTFPTTGDLGAKLHDLQIIYRAFDTAMANRYIENNDLLAELSRYFTEDGLRTSYFYIDHFSQFTAQEQELVTALIKGAKQVTIGLVLDQGNANKVAEKTDLFYKSSRLYADLVGKARQVQIPVLTDSYAQPKENQNPDLSLLEDFWISSRRLVRTQSESLVHSDSIQVFEADSRYIEIRQVATKIRQLVATKGYRYRDFMILTRHLDSYETVIPPVFNEFQIPYFNDLQHAMADHPLVELLAALFEVKAKHYQYGAMMRLLKTELLIPQVDAVEMPIERYRSAVDLTENMVLKYGFSGSQWLRKDDWTFYRFDFTDADEQQTDKDQAITTQINQIRHFVQTILPPFFEQLDQATTGEAGAKLVYQFLVENGVTKRLLSWRDRYLAAGNIARSEEPEQTWQTFVGMLDEYVETLGKQTFNADDFMALIQAGFEGASYSQVPSTLDQVVISESGMVQMNNRKITFMIGSTDMVMPEQVSQTQLLTDDDRAQMAGELTAEQYLSDSAISQMAAEPFLNYLAFLGPREQLIFSYPSGNDGEKNLNPSPYLMMIKEHFNLSTQQLAANPELTEQSALDFVGTKRSTLSSLVVASRLAKTRLSPMPDSWLYLLRQLMADSEIGPLTKQLLGSLDYKNVPVKLTQEIITDLYGKRLDTSISKLETFYRNPFEYFLQYGLKLKERDVFELSPASTGEFFHMGLDELMKAVADNNQVYANVTKEQLDDYLNAILKDMRDLPQFQILGSSSRMGYIAKQLSLLLKQVTHAMWQQDQQTKMKPLKTEVLFGHVGAESGLKALTYALPKGRSVNVRGKIDRIDYMKGESKQYLGIVDYKSGIRKFDFSDAYYGLSMQMLTYLQALIENADAIAPDTGLETAAAGAVYMHLQNPKLKMADVQAKGFEETLLKANQMDGLLLEDNQLLSNLDTDFEDESLGYSLIYPFRKTKKGFTSPSSLSKKLITQTDLNLLLGHNKQLITDAATDIFSGSTNLSPARWNAKKTALQYSPYKSIFQFDAMLPENNYHEISKLSWEEIERRLTDGEDDE
ncbi:PD-(D/E)XK nuclease family protein [Dellaglioa carnosa]|uniref:PD-(D/E)XK nuclease family protein n=1 Tax=Dellaglioa carnosa TaxID=2995136 RepID=UPI0022A8443B|nr:PD-(D/E)XK nuclease family protein [Dellaglioa carnosa]MCZ2493090.1 PD-(D/E)XK nuclease family protein [Dellaglioa carnosa]